MRRLFTVLASLGLLAAVVVGLLQAGDGGAQETPQAFDLAQARRQLTGAPPPLAGLHQQSTKLLGGGERAFERRLVALRGYPIVVNKWASWCGPCATEFPYFQHAATKYGKQIAFLGVDAKDGAKPARAFLARKPVPFPSYEDPGLDISARLKVPLAWPSTVFLDERGEIAYIKQGTYRTQADLERDIERYL